MRFRYDGGRPSMIFDFCSSGELSVMIMNMQAFDSDDNILNDRNRDAGYLLGALQKVRPVLILDEPQEGMDTPNMQQRLREFNPLFKLRYSATHKVAKNMVYRLLPNQAYSQRLVKGIAAYGVSERNTESEAPVVFVKGVFTNSAPKARLKINRRMRGGEVKTNSQVTVQARDDLFQKSGGLSAYSGLVVEDIRKEMGVGRTYIRFTNGREIDEEGASGIAQEEIFTSQIRYAICSHLEIKDKLRDHGIKPIALFFIDRVANYMDTDGLIRTIFEREYAAIHQERHGSDPANIQSVHNGYFAKTKQGAYTDNKNSMMKNREIYDLIMRDKERLLQFDNPLEFLFSHSALGVGWDNPNVFTICTLHERPGEIGRRQEVGRGLRLPINQEGVRWRDPDDAQESDRLNILTVVTSGSFSDFYKGYQQELVDLYGEELPVQIRDKGRKPQKLTLQKDKLADEAFQEMWKRISKKTRMIVHFDEDQLVENCFQSIRDIRGAEREVELEGGRIRGIAQDFTMNVEYLGSLSEKLAAKSFSADELITTLADKTGLGWSAACRILLSAVENSEEAVTNNVEDFLSQAIPRIKFILRQEVVRVAEYQPTGEEYPISEFKDSETLLETVPAPRRGLYDLIPVESKEPEKEFTEMLEANGRVRIFCKLPRWYKIETPAGTYNPDFAIVAQSISLDSNGDDRVAYYVVETKSESDPARLSPEEQMKIQCAVKHFKAIGFEYYLAPVRNKESFNQRALSESSGKPEEPVLL